MAAQLIKKCKQTLFSRSENIMKQKVKIIAIFIFLLSGCTKDDPVSNPFLPLPPSTEGQWIGIIPNDTKFTLNVTQDRAAITGTGTVISLGNGSGYSCNVIGTNTYPDVALTIGVKGYIAIEMTGQFLSETEISGVLNKSGFNNFPITFTKQP